MLHDYKANIRNKLKHEYVHGSMNLTMMFWKHMCEKTFKELRI